MISDKIKHPFAKNTVNIFLCFLLTSTGYFLWLYNLRSMIGDESSDIMTTIIGYFLQAFGILVYDLIRKKKTFSPKSVFVVSTALYIAFLVPAALSNTLAGALVFGFADSLLCGIIAAHYLCRLTEEIKNNKYALSFGVGYALSTVTSWLISLISSTQFINISLIICIVVAALIIPLNLKSQSTQTVQTEHNTNIKLHLKKTVILYAILIILFSLVNNIGFNFQSDGTQAALGIEFSRMFYGVGLVFAGIISDKSRKNSAICTMASLATPFITLSLRGETVPLTLFWALSYFAFGFYSVFRIVAFSDIAKKHNLIFLSGLGLMFGRIGDAAGAGIYQIKSGTSKFEYAFYCGDDPRDAKRITEGYNLAKDSDIPKIKSYLNKKLKEYPKFVWKIMTLE